MAFWSSALQFSPCLCQTKANLIKILHISNKFHQPSDLVCYCSVQRNALSASEIKMCPAFQSTQDISLNA